FEGSSQNDCYAELGMKRSLPATLFGESFYVLPYQYLPKSGGMNNFTSTVQVNLFNHLARLSFSVALNETVQQSTIHLIAPCCMKNLPTIWGLGRAIYMTCLICLSLFVLT